MKRLDVPAELVDAFVRAAVPGPGDHRAGDVAVAKALLKQHPGTAETSIYAAAVAGDAAALRRWLRQDRKLATTAGGAMGWQPLCYVCFSRFLRLAKKKQRRDFLACARMLLRAGAGPNSAFTNPGDGVRESALYGAAGVANDAPLTRLLLKAGADVNDGETLYHAAEFPSHDCLKLVLARKPENISFCMCHKMDQEDPAGVGVFLKYGADPNFLIERGANDLHGLRPLHFAILRNRSPKTVRVLLHGGADPLLPSSAGVTPYAFAMILGRRQIAAELRRHGGATALSPKEQFLAACSAGKTTEANRLVRADPTLTKSLTPHERALLPLLAGEGNFPAVRVMLATGFPIDTPGPWGGSAIHQAAWAGHVPIVRFLLKRGASLTCKQCFGGEVLQTAIHGATHAGHPHGPAIVRLIKRALTQSL